MRTWCLACKCAAGAGERRAGARFLHVGCGRAASLPGWARLLLGNLLVLVALLAAGLLAGELYYRFGYDATDALEYNKVSVRWFERHYHQNSWGCRDKTSSMPTPSSRAKPGHLFRGFLYRGARGQGGGSAVRLPPAAGPSGLGSPRAGASRVDTSNELQSMCCFLTNHYEVDQVVLVCTASTDIGDLLPEGAAAMQRVYDDVDHSGWLRRHSYFVNTVYNRMGLSWNPDLKRYFRLTLAAHRGPAWPQQRQRLKELRDLVQSHGGHFSVVTFPFFQSLGPNYEVLVCARRARSMLARAARAASGLAAGL